VLLDGAHNPAGAAALALAVDDLRPFLEDGPVTVITASMADKDVDGVIAALAGDHGSPVLRAATVVCTSLDVPRAMPAEALAARWQAGRAGPLGSDVAGGPTRSTSQGSVVVEPDPIAAIDRAISTGRGPVVIAGSLYLVGMARGHLVDDPDLRDPDPAEDR
jgi:dihydrofolate synthase/folylpolyglutamate synthase